MHSSWKDLANRCGDRQYLEFCNIQVWSAICLLRNRLFACFISFHFSVSWSQIIEFLKPELTFSDPFWDRRRLILNQPQQLEPKPVQRQVSTLGSLLTSEFASDVNLPRRRVELDEDRDYGRKETLEKLKLNISNIGNRTHAITVTVCSPRDHISCITLVLYVISPSWEKSFGGEAELWCQASEIVCFKNAKIVVAGLLPKWRIRFPTFQQKLSTVEN